VPGIGKKTAERLLLELKGKLAEALPDTGSAPTAPAAVDIQQALLALGYNEREAEAALKSLPIDVGVAEGIRLALKALSR
jgi:Holliday junction DNA helicase RuvA